MKKIVLSVGIALIVIAASCNNPLSDNNKPEQMKQDKMKMDSMQMDSTMHHDRKEMDSMRKK